MHLVSKNPKADIVTEEKDLGVLIYEELKFHKHVSAVVSKANLILGIVKQTFDTLDNELLPIVYQHQVRPHAFRIWKYYVASSLYSKYENKIEGVQHRATKLIPELKDKPYQERLHSLNLYSMEYRRKKKT